MKNFITKSINNKIIITIVGLISIITFLNYWGIRGVLKDNLMLGHINKLTNIVREIRMELYDHFSEYEISEMKKIEKKIETVLKIETQKEFNNILNSLKKDEKKKIIEDLGISWNTYLSSLPKLYEDSRGLNKLEAVMNENKKYKHIFTHTISELEKFASPYMIRSQDELTTRIIKVFVLSLWVGLSLAVYFYTILNIQIVKRIDNILSATRRMVQGDFSQHVVDDKNDEINELTNSFNLLSNKVKDQINIITENNLNLELKVKERTRELETILVNVSSAFLLIDQSGLIQQGFTASCEKLFGEKITAGNNLCEYLKLNSRSAETFICMVDQVFDDILPEEITLDQIPKHYKINNKILELDSRAIRDFHGNVVNVLFTINDVTQLRQTEKENDLNRLLIKIIKNKFSFETFIKETRKLLEISVSDMAKAQRNLHTIKGNLGLYGLGDIAHFVDEVEETILRSSKFDDHDIQNIEKMIKGFLQDHYDIIGVDWDANHSEKFYLSEEEFISAENSILKIDNMDKIKRRVHQVFIELRSRSIKELLGPMSEIVQRLSIAERKKIKLKIINGHIKVIPDLFNPIISNIIHLIRNSIVHGIERNRKNKPEKGEIELSFFDQKKGWVIQLKDDGQGIDPRVIKKVAIEKKVFPTDRIDSLSDQEIIDLIFKPGLTTMTRSTLLAGRGVGMDSVKNAIEKLNGIINVTSKIGEGTTFSLYLPRPNSMIVQE